MDQPTQRSLFDEVPPAPSFHLADPSVSAAERPRLGRQCQAILDRLQRGPASNLELAGLALKYTSRISDLRASGHEVRAIERDHESGRVVYALFVDGRPVN